ncbi:MAG: histidine kinase [Lewinellaceae bacterium]|nr:histidine kinase [Lewinellaceae bacterium]MCB9331505.1 histidine kinase [Lewinellaceae bacterium]
MSKGLSTNLIYRAFQDSDGYIWFGTDKGLVKYDSHRFRKFTTNEGLIDPEVLNIWEDSKRNLWISCFRRKPSYRRFNKFMTEKEDVILKDIDIYLGFCNFHEDDGVWFLGFSKRIYNLNHETVKVLNFTDAVSHLARIDQDLYAFATKSFFLVKNDKPTLFYTIGQSPGKSSVIKGINSNGNRILYSYDDRIILFELNQKRVKKIDSIYNVSGVISIDRSGRFWVCSTQHGAICFDNQNRDLSNPKIYLPGKKTTYMFEDTQGTFWFCTLDDGIYGLPIDAPITWQEQDGLPSNNLVSVSRDARGRILFGDDGGNLNILDGTKHSVEQYGAVDGYNRILQILPQGKDSCWLITDEGAFLQHTSLRKTVPINVGGSPKVILRDGATVWFGTSARLSSLNTHTRKLSDHLINQRITALAKDSEGIIWAGGIEGIYNTADTFRTNWGKQFKTLGTRIIAMQGAANNTLWIATPESGLFKARVENGKIIELREANAFLSTPVQNIHSMFQEDNGWLWLATNQGIFGIDPHTWHQVHFDHHDGLTNDDIRGVYVQNDTLWAASASGLTRVLLKGTPATGQFASFVTAVRYHQENDEIKEIFLDEDPSLRKVTTLPRTASLVEIDFAGLDYRSRGNLLFDCIITEVLPPLQWLTTDNLLNWIGSGFQGKADTTRLYKNGLDFGIRMPPGKYKINVTAVTQRGIRSWQPGEWTFVMPARWYSTFWFSLLIWSLIGLGLYRIYRTRLQLREMAFAVAQFRLMALQAQINPHFIGNCINALQRFFYPPQPTQASIYNATFTQLLRQTLDFSEYTFIRFDQELEYNRDYMELARLRYGDDKFRYKITGTDTIPPNLPFPALFLQPILENATIHGGAVDEVSTVVIEYKLENNRVYCLITDNGPGIHARTNRTKDHLRKSKGIRMLHNKAATLNLLFDLDLEFVTKDLSDNTPPERGTQAVISFDTHKVRKAQQRQIVLDKKTQKLKRTSKYQPTDEAD